MVNRRQICHAAVDNAKVVLPAISGNSYKIVSVYLAARNLAATDCTGIYVQGVDRSGQNFDLPLPLIPSVANLNQLHYDSLNIDCASGSYIAVYKVGSGANYPEWSKVVIVYEEQLV